MLSSSAENPASVISSAANAYRKVAPFTSTLVSLLSGSTMTMASMSRLHQRLVMSEMGLGATVRGDIVASAIGNNRPLWVADISQRNRHVRFTPKSGHS